MQQVTVGQSSGSGWTSGVWRTRLLALCGVLLWGLTAIPAHAVLQTFTATLNGAQQVPPTASPATGSATIVLDTVTNIITINESFTGLTGTATAVHIHDAPAGSNGPVVVDLTGVPAATSGTVPQQTATLTSAQVTDLQAGNFYTNIHTAPFPGGEIRGQFVLPNVTIAKTGPASVLAGSNITYTLAITNNGLGYAQSVTLSDVLPAGVTFVSQSQPAVGPQFNLLNTGNTISDTIAILAPGASQTITVVAAIPANAAAGSTLSNTATVTTASFDPNIATNGTSTVNTTVNTQADLSVNITGPATAIPGSDVTYTITQTNNGPSDAQSTGVFGTLPSHTSLVSFTQSSGPANGAPLPPGGTQTFTLVIYIDPATPSGTILPIPANTFSTTSDTNSANNQSTFNTTVQDQITGTGNDDVLVVNATGPNSGTYQLTSNGVVGPVISFTGILSFSFNGGAGNDTLIINNPVGGLFAPVNGINYDGGGQNGAPGDSLQIVGGSETSATYTYGSTDANGHNGTITLVNGGTTALYHYTGLAPITNTGTASDIIFNLPSGDGDNLAQLGDNGNLNDGLSRLSSGNATFETTDFANPTNSLTINDSSDGETVRVSRLDNGYTSSITVNGGAGANTLTVNNSNDFAASVYNLTPTSIVGSTLPPVTYNNIQTLNVTGGQNSDTFNVQASAATTYNLDGNNPTGAPGDVLNYDAQGRAVTRGANSITSLGVQPVNYLNFETVNILNAIPRLSINNVTLAEGNSGTTNAVFTVTLDVPNSAAPVTVNYATANGTATTADNDYVATSGTLTFTPGQTTQTLIVPINGDLKFEPNETFTVNLSNAANATIATATGTGTIRNDDVQPTVSINSVTAKEGNSGTSNFTFTATLSNPSSLPITVGYATADGTATVADNDYVAQNGTLTFAPGETSKTITIAVNGDTKQEPDETFTVNLSAPTNATIATATGTGTILNDDGQPSISVADVTANEGNAGNTPFSFTVSLSNASSQSVSVNYATANGTATAGVDYTTSAGTLTFAPGETSKTIVVSVLGNNLSAPDKSFTFNLNTPSNATIARGQAVGTILNDDGALSINDVTVTKPTTGTTNANFTVSLANPSSQTITVDYLTINGTAKAGSDFTAVSGTLTFAPGQTSQTIAVPIIGNTINGDTSTFTVNLANPTKTTLLKAQGTGTILNANSAPTVSVNSVSVVEGNLGDTNKALFTVSLNNLSGKTVTVDYATADGTAKAGSDYVATSGTLTFSPGQTTQIVPVQIIGDNLVEGNETFFVNLVNAVNATLANSVGTGLIQDDDTAPPVLNPIVSVQFTNVGTGNIFRSLPTVVGSAGESNAPAGANLTVQVSIQRQSDKKFFDGSGWSTSPTLFPANFANGTWTLPTGALPNNTPNGQLLIDDQYTLTATANDGLGHTATDSVTLSIDHTSPTISITQPQDKAELTRLGAIGGHTSDAPGGTGVKQVLLSIIRASDGKSFNGTNFVTSPVVGGKAQPFALSTNLDAAKGVWSRRTGLPGGTSLQPGTYRLLAIAIDGAGNRAQATSSFTVQSSTAGPPTASTIKLSLAKTSVAGNSVQLRFLGALDAESAGDAAHYTATVNGMGITVESAGYDSTIHSVTLSLPDGSLHAGDKVTVQWSGVSDAQGALLQGQGGPFVAR